MADCQLVGAVSLAMRLSGFGWQSRPSQEMGLGTRLPPRCRDQASPQVRCNPGYCSKWLDSLGKLRTGYGIMPLRVSQSNMAFSASGQAVAGVVNP
jgi:hypothetical protein